MEKYRGIYFIERKINGIRYSKRRTRERERERERENL